MFTITMTINHVLPKGKVLHFEKLISDRVKIWLQQNTHMEIHFLFFFNETFFAVVKKKKKKKKKNVIFLINLKISHSNN